LRFVHTADWQIGKPFARFGAKADALRAARLDAIESIGRLAAAEDAAHVLVAGDVFDSDTPSRVTLLAPFERMRAFPRVIWHLLPGNHDPHRPGGVWERAAMLGVPENVRLHLAPAPLALDDNAFILPAPLTNKSETRDLTQYMDTAATPEGAIRIGLAHGSVVNFASEGDASNPIDPARAERAGLAWLALGDWHHTRRINERTCYAGTPEPDRHDSQSVGTALLVSVDGPRATPQVTETIVGTFRWHSIACDLADGAQLAGIEAELRRNAEPLSRLVLKLVLRGSVPLAAHGAIAPWRERLEAAICHLDYDDGALHARPDQTDLESIDFDGVLRTVAETLRARMSDAALPEPERRAAEDALILLYTEGQRDEAA
jgi:DNA repair exonuclease SbcCD nuclease subunit